MNQQTPTLFDTFPGFGRSPERTIAKQPETSLAANREMTKEMREGHYKRILDVLNSPMNYEALKELELKNLVRKTGEKSLTRAGRAAYNYEKVL